MQNSGESMEGNGVENDLLPQQSPQECGEASNSSGQVDIGCDLLYGVNDNPPIMVSVLYGLQHYLLALGPLLMLPLLVMRIICVDDSSVSSVAMTEILGTFFVVSGVATFVQTTFGIRLALMQGITISFFVPAVAMMNNEENKCPRRIPTPNSTSVEISEGVYYYQENDGTIASSTEVWQRRMREIQAAVAIASIVQIIVGASGVLGFLIRFIGPLTIAPCLILITFSIIDLAIKLAGTQWGIAIFGVAIMIICSQYLGRVQVPMPGLSIKRRKVTWTRRPIFAMFPILISILISWILCHILTVAGAFTDDRNAPAFQARTDAKPNLVANTPWFRVPYPFQWGLPTPTLGGTVGMIAAATVGIVESVADYYACARISRAPPPPAHAINRGILVEGFGIMLAGVLGTGNATTSFSTNIVAIGITRVSSRRVMQIAGVLFVCLGLFTKICGVFVMIPSPILGAVILSVVGMIGSVGMSNLCYMDMSNSRNLFILGLSTFMGMTVQTWAKTNASSIDVGVQSINNLFSVLLQTGMLVGGFIGFFLDNTVPGTDESRGIKSWIQPANEEISTDNPTYDLPFPINFRFAKHIPFCPTFRRKNDSAV